MTTTLRVRLLGQISLQHSQQPLVDLPAKALELLSYLLLHHARAHTRDTLAELLWPETSGSLSQKYLRQTLWQLQSTLEGPAADNASSGEPLLQLEPGWVRINPQAQSWWVDTARLEQAYSTCRDLPGRSVSAEQAQMLMEAVDLYQGDLLESWYHDWCIYERERLQLTYLALLDKLIDYCISQRLFSRGIEYGQRILRYDRAREQTYQQLMRLYYLAGDRSTALRTYTACTTALVREFGVQPAAQTVALYEQIRADRVEEEGNLPLVRQSAVPSPHTTNPLDLHYQLLELQNTLHTFQHQVQTELAAILGLLAEQQKTR